MSAEGIGPTPGEYIRHHLTHLTNQKQGFIVDFSVINIDSVIFSSLLGAIVCFFLWRAARTAHAGVPGRFQAAVEMLVEMVDSQAKGRDPQRPQPQAGSHRWRSPCSAGSLP